MKFMDWCVEAHGIVEFSVGCSTHIFLPALPQAIVAVFDELSSCEAYVINPIADPMLRGIVIPREQFADLMMILQTRYHNDLINESQSYKDWLEHFFIKFGVDVSLKIDLQALHFLEVSYQAPHIKNHLYHHFQSFFIGAGFDESASGNVLLFSGRLLPYLLHLYEQSVPCIEPNFIREEQIQILLAFKNPLNHTYLSSALDMAQQLSYTFYHSLAPNAAHDSVVAAMDFYNTSLKLYANLYRESLSFDDYSDLHYASAQLQHLISRDSPFLRSLKRLYANNVGVLKDPTLLELPDGLGHKIMDFINEKTMGSLYGNTVLNLSGFFQSVTNSSYNSEIVIHTEGHANFYISRIVAVGMLRDGVIAGMNDTPLYKHYFKVEHGPVLGQSISNETRIKRLIPCSSDFAPVIINPEENPAEYQIAMEFTIKQLLLVERQLALYEKPDEIEAEIAEWMELLELSPQAKEWRRLDKLKNLLSGVEHPQPITYFRRCPLSPTMHVYNSKIVANKSGYSGAQPNPLASIKHFVFSILGTSLATRHFNFMQQHNSAQCYQAIEEKIKLLLNLSHSLSDSPSPTISPPLIRRHSATPSPVGSSPIAFVISASPDTIFSSSPKKQRPGIIRPKTIRPNAEKPHTNTVEDIFRRAGNASRMPGVGAIKTIEETSQGIEITCKNNLINPLINTLKRVIPPESSIQHSADKVILPLSLFAAFCNIMKLSSAELLISLRERQAEHLSKSLSEAKTTHDL